MSRLQLPDMFKPHLEGLVENQEYSTTEELRPGVPDILDLLREEPALESQIPTPPSDPPAAQTTQLDALDTPEPDLVQLFDDDDPMPGSYRTFCTRELKEAYASGDYTAIRTAEEKVRHDLTPNWNSIKENGENAFTEVTNGSDGLKYRLSTSENGWIWVYVAPRTPSEQQWVQIGTYTSSGKTLEIAELLWDAAWGDAGGAAAELVAFLIARFLQDHKSGYRVSVARAVRAARVSPKFASITAGFWKVAVRFLRGAIIGAIVSVLIVVIISVVWKEYNLKFYFHNWDKNHAWTITDWHSDNAIVPGGGEKWRPAEIPAARAGIKMPDGTAKEAEVACYAMYIFQNDGRWLLRLGVAMKVVNRADPSKGFLVKYDLPRFGGNRIGLKGGLDTDLVAFSQDGSSWAPAGSLKQTTTYEGLTLTITTDYLGGAPDSVYRADVHIGV